MKKLFTSILAVILLFSFIAPVNVHAYYETPSNLRQTGFNTDSIDIAWDAAPDTAKYVVTIKNENYEKIPVGETTATTFTINKANYPALQSGNSYQVYVTAYGAAGEEGGYTYTDMLTKVDTVRNFRQTKWWYYIEKVDVEWDRCTGVDGYEVKLYDSKGKCKKTQKITSNYTTSTDFKVKNTMIYKIKIRAYQNFNGTTYYSNAKTITSFTQPRITSAKLSGKKLKVKWNKVSGATSYDIYVSTKKTSGYKKVKSVKASKSSATVTKYKKKKLKKGKKYYVYVVTRKKKNTSGALYYWNTKDSNFGYLK